MGIAEQAGIRPYTGQTTKEATAAKGRQEEATARQKASGSGTDQLGKPLAREVDRQLVGMEKRIAVLEEQLKLLQVRLDLLHDAVGVTLGNAADALLSNAEGNAGNAGNASPVTRVTPEVTQAIEDVIEHKRQLAAERQKRWKARRKSQKPASSGL